MRRPLTTIESLEVRQCLSGSTTLSDPSIGMMAMEVKTRVSYGTVVVPQRSSDGKTITITGTDKDDTITVQRVTKMADDIADGEADFASYKNTDGSPVWMSSNFLSQYSDPQWLKDYRDDLAEQERELESMKHSPYPEPAPAIAGMERSADIERGQIETGERFVTKFANGDFVRITLAGVYDYFFDVTQMKNAELVIQSGTGADKVTIAPNVPLTASVDGGSGADTLTTGLRSSTLFGGGGNDRLVNRSVDGGTLDGGRGADAYVNQAATHAVSVRARTDGDRLDVGGTLVSATAPMSYRTLGAFPTKLSIALKHGGYTLLNDDDSVMRRIG